MKRRGEAAGGRNTIQRHEDDRETYLLQPLYTPKYHSHWVAFYCSHPSVCCLFRFMMMIEEVRERKETEKRKRREVSFSTKSYNNLSLCLGFQLLFFCSI